MVEQWIKDDYNDSLKKCEKCGNLCWRVRYEADDNMDLCCLCDGADPCEECEKRDFIILIINGKKVSWKNESISYDELVNLVFPNSQKLYTIQYTHGYPYDEKGSLTKGNNIKLLNNEIIDIVATDNS